MKTTLATATTQVVAAAEGAYSQDRYTAFAWTRIARFLLHEGATQAEAEWVLRSKHMRWASDNANRSSHTTYVDFLKYLAAPRVGGVEALLADARKDLAPAKMTGADLAGFCEGEQIADLIDLARRAANGDDVKMDAKILMSGILARAKR